MVEIGRRGVADGEELEAEYHVVPSCPEAFHNVVVFVEKVECVFVGV